MALLDLKGVAAHEVPHTFIENATHVRQILKNKEYGTTADSNGAINIYRDDSGAIRCQQMRLMAYIKDDVVKSVKSAVEWYKQAMIEIA